jgi:MFS superfamily sulfate permease-like transporter
VGYKLAKTSYFKHFGKGKYQFILLVPYYGCTTDLLKGVALGIVISIIFILKGNFCL